MGNGNYLLGAAFNWIQRDDGRISVHLCQLAFTKFTALRLSFHTANKVPNMTPFSSGFTTDSILPVDSLDPDLPCCKKVYQSIVGFINCLATCTRPDISPVLKFLASYSNFLYQQHYKAAVHALNYLTRTNEYGISFHSKSSSTIHAFNNFTHHNYTESYNKYTASSPSECHQLTAFCDAFWGGQCGSAVDEGTPQELFKFRSISGFLICRSSSPISCKSIRQNQTALNSCKSEIMATN